MIHEQWNNTYLPLESETPTVDSALFEAYSRMIATNGFHVVPTIEIKSISKVGSNEWHVTASNVYGFYALNDLSPFLEGTFDNIVKVTVDDDVEIDCVEGHVLFVDHSQKVNQKNEAFEKLVKQLGKSEGDVFSELINTLKFNEYGVGMIVKVDDALQGYEWGDYFANYPIDVIQLHQAP